MSANIYENRLFSVGKTWHGIGTVVESPKTAKEAIELSNLNYTVEAQPIYLSSGIEIPNRKAIVNLANNVALGIVSDQYKIIQNVEAFNFFDTLVGEGEAIYTSAGALGFGERVFVQAKLPSTITVKTLKDGTPDIIEKYLLLVTGHDGKISTFCFWTPTRCICQNSLNLALSNADNGIKIRHKGNVMNSLSEARDVLGISINFYNQFEKVVKKMETIELQTKDLNAYFNKVLGVNDKMKNDKGELFTKTQNKLDKLSSLYHNGRGNEGKTLYDGYNAITEFCDHFSSVRGLKENPSNRLDNIWFGTGAQIKNRAYEEAIAIMG